VLIARPATAEDVAVVYPDLTCSFKAMACDLDGQRVGLIGLALTRPTACLFCWFDEKLRPYLKSLTVLRLLKKVERWLNECRAAVLTIRDRKEPKAPHILKRLGFRFHALHDGDAIYIRGRV
jgi:hypothetical protein